MTPIPDGSSHSNHSSVSPHTREYTPVVLWKRLPTVPTLLTKVILNERCTYVPPGYPRTLALLKRFSSNLPFLGDEEPLDD